MKNILVIEDDKTLQQSYRRMLSEFSCTFADTADRAIAALSKTSFDYVTCDYNLALGNGRDVFDWLTANKPDQLERFIFICGSFDDVATINASFLQKGSMGLKEDLLERIAEVA